MHFDHDSQAFELDKPELRAVMAFASADETREHLNAVHFDAEAGAVVATDGHTMIRCNSMAKGKGAFTVPLAALQLAAKVMTRKAHVLRVSRFKDDCAAVEVFDTTNERSPKRVAGWTPGTVDNFPPYDAVVGGLNHESAACKYGINPEYLARLALLGKMGVKSLRPCATGEHDPVAYRGDGHGTEVLAMIMPMRI